MKAKSLTELYHALSQWSQECSGKLSGNDRNKLNHLIVELDTAITVNKQGLDKDNINICLEALHRLIPNLQWQHCDDNHLLALLDFFTQEEISLLLGVKIGTVYAAKQNIRRRGKSAKLSDGEFMGADIESVKKMTDEEFDQELELSARVRQLMEVRKSGLPGVQVARDVLINKRNRQQKELEQMWALAKDFLAWMTGDFVPAAMKKFSNIKPPFDVKVLVSEILSEEYTELFRKYQEVKPRAGIPREIPDEIVKKAKRRGKLKWTRKQEEKEAKLLKASSSSVPIGDGESPETSVSEKTVS